MTFETLTIGKFGFTEVMHDEIPYRVAGYARGMCSDSSRFNTDRYIPPKGWLVTSCIQMPDGTHGVAAGEPTILVWCEPDAEIIEIDESPSLDAQLKPIGGLTGVGILTGITGFAIAAYLYLKHKN